MYSYGQFCRTPIGKMRVRKASNVLSTCVECKLARTSCWENYELLSFCAHKIPEDAYIEKPNVGGKDQHK